MASPIHGPQKPSWCRRGLAVSLFAALGFSLAACDTPVHVRGHVSDPESMEAIKTYKSQIILVALFAVLIAVGIAVS